MLPVDALGHPARLDETHEIANRYGLVVIEDLYESHVLSDSGLFCVKSKDVTG